MAIIGKSLNHKNVNITAIYARLVMVPVRKSMEKAAGAMFAESDLLAFSNAILRGMPNSLAHVGHH